MAFLLGWMTHVVSDALFKGCYPHAAPIDFFGHQYAMAMLPAAETLSMADISYDFGASWPAWRASRDNRPARRGGSDHAKISGWIGRLDPGVDRRQIHRTADQRAERLR